MKRREELAIIALAMLALCIVWCSAGAQDGWVFTPLGKNNFAAEQLASLHVSLSGLPIGKPKGVPVSTISPTLTLTSTSGYTRTVSVPPGQNFSFLALDAGTYTLTPQLGEFEFAPGSVSVEIKKGEQAEVSLQGTRVAYRCLPPS